MLEKKSNIFPDVLSAEECLHAFLASYFNLRLCSKTSLFWNISEFKKTTTSLLTNFNAPLKGYDEKKKVLNFLSVPFAQHLSVVK